MTVDVVTRRALLAPLRPRARAPAAPAPRPPRPEPGTGALTERVRTSSSPARDESASRVRTSPIPGSTTVVPNSDRNPSAADAPPAPGLGQVLEARQGEKSLASPLADHAGEVGDGGDVGHLVQGQHDGGGAVSRRRGVRCQEADRA